MVDINKIAEQLANLTVREANALSKELKEKYGIEPSGHIVAPVTTSTSTEGTSSSQNDEEKTSFSVLLKTTGGQKLAVIKILRDILGVGLKEAKDIADVGNKIIKENISKAEAEDIKKKLTDVGAEVELK